VEQSLFLCLFAIFFSSNPLQPMPITTILLRITFLLLLAVPFSLFSQERGSPFIRNFKPKKDYNGHSQNWTVLQADNGLLYVGNNNSLLEYDGVNFTPVEGLSVLRCLNIDKNGILYAGAKSEFGYFRTDSTGKLNYVSLSKALSEENKKFGNVWKVIVKGDDIFFNAFEAIFHYKNFELQKVYKPETSFFLCFLIDNELYVSELKKGLKKLEHGEFKLVKNGEKVATDRVYNMLKYDKESILLGSRRMGFYLYNPQSNEFTKFSTEADSAILKGKYAAVVKSEDKYILFGTTAGESGVVVTDKQGKLVQLINKNTGLQDNIVFDIVQDQQQGFWLPLNNGLSRVELNYPITNWNEINGLEGNKCYSVIRYKGKIYVGTAQGVYALEKNGLFKKIEGNATLHIWNFIVYKTPDNKELLLFCNQNGIWKIEDNKAIFMADANNAYVMLAMRENPKYLLCGTREGITVLEYAKDKFIEKVKIKELEGEVRNLLYDATGNLWTVVEKRGVYKLNQFSNTDFQPQQIQKFGTEQGIDLNNDIKLCLYNDKVMIATVSKIFQQTATGIEPFTLNKEFEDKSKSINQLMSDNHNNLWIGAVEENDKLLLGYMKPNREFYNKIFRRLPLMEINGLYADSANIIWMATSEGLFRYDASMTFEPTKNFTTLIRKVALENDSVLFHGHYADFTKGRWKNVNSQTAFFTPTLPYQFNSLIFHYAAPTFDGSSGSQEYSYMLEGFEKDWSAWVKDTKKEYTNLREGTYTFKVKAKNIYEDESTVATYQFTILPPWYRTWWAYLIYAVLSIAVLYLTVKYYTQRLKKENEKLEKMVQERTAEISLKNQVLEKQKAEISMQKDAIAEQNLKIQEAYEEIQQQQEEILTQRDNLAHAYENLDKSYRNVKTLSEIGQQITAVLDAKAVIKTVYDNVNQLMDAAAFGIGVYDEKRQEIIFDGFMEKGEELPLHTHPISEKVLATICFERQEKIVINNLYVDYQLYIDQPLKEAVAGELPKSLIYMPLSLESKRIGVITVQSFDVNAYDEYDITMLENLATYVSIALDNAKAYQTIDEKNQKIISSIRYAQTIQQAILPSTDLLHTYFPENFVLYKPKDVVSGDFYWMSVVKNRQTNNVEKVYLGVLDCTGHGVPGAFMSMIGNTLLNKIASMADVYQPADMLEALHQEIRVALHQEEEANKDGMDVCLVCFEAPLRQDTAKISFAGAKRNLYITKPDGQVRELKGSRKLIGGLSSGHHRFETHQTILTKGDCIYLTTDGYVDQNNNKRESFTTYRFKELISKIQAKPCAEQKMILDNTLAEHQGQEEQRDDITIIGIKIS
jgi:serine phosphatase RsbU (regulator of sigma subunit)/ligand-binding sensor domain-containing protein